MEKQSLKTQEAEFSVTELLKPQPEVIVLSGGPCGGKSSVMQAIEERASQQPRPIEFIPEFATKFMEDGIDLPYLAQNHRSLFVQAEYAILTASKSAIERAKQRYAGQDALIICDRGPADIAAYLQPDELADIAHSTSLELNTLAHEQIDRVLYLPSLASLDPEAYTKYKSTNPTRYEDAAAAAVLDATTLRQWQHHPEMHIVTAQTFAETLKTATDWAFGGKDEYEAKWHVEPFEATHWLQRMAEQGKLLNTAAILQSYHILSTGEEVRLRQSRGSDGYITYLLSQKSENRELKCKLQKDEYEQLYSGLMTLAELTKTRHTILHNHQLWELDIYEKAGHIERVILEAEVASKDQLAVLQAPLPASPTTKSAREYAR